LRYNLEHSYLLAFLYARAFTKLIKSDCYDIILAPRASTEIALLKTPIPIVYYTDTTFHSLYNYYEWFSGFSSFSVWEGNRIEKKALENASACIFTSEWAADSAREFYKIAGEKVHIIPWGPNLESIPLREEVLTPKQSDTCNLLFLGVEWHRKGGELAFNAFKHLKNRGYKAKLTICGCIPPTGFHDDDMTIIPFINKNTPEAKHQFHQLMLSHHFLVLPMGWFLLRQAPTGCPLSRPKPVASGQWCITESTVRGSRYRPGQKIMQTLLNRCFILRTNTGR
jgi:glycosyltransferase involved in cell wall biosynthesis